MLECWAQGQDNLRVVPGQICVRTDQPVIGYSVIAELNMKYELAVFRVAIPQAFRGPMRTRMEMKWFVTPGEYVRHLIREDLKRWQEPLGGVWLDGMPHPKPSAIAESDPAVRGGNLRTASKTNSQRTAAKNRAASRKRRAR